MPRKARKFSQIITSGPEHLFSHMLTGKLMCALVCKTPVVVIVMLSLLLFSGITWAKGPILKITVLYNNIPHATHLKTGWGFSCLIQGMKHTILFDTGGDGDILLDNMRLMGVDPAAIDRVILSHIHADHVGGLERFLQQNPKVIVYVPVSFPRSFQQKIKSYGADLKTVSRMTRLFDNVYSTGEMGNRIREQALILDTSNGLVVITGCAHPGVADIVKKAKKTLKKDVYLVMGGFHLMGMPADRIQEIVEILKEMGVKKVAPSHCTGEQAMVLFRNAWADDFVEGGAGAVIRLYR